MIDVYNLLLKLLLNYDCSEVSRQTFQLKLSNTLTGAPFAGN
jgi:hypothetical protein